MLKKGRGKIKRKGRKEGKEKPFLSPFSFKSFSGHICWQPYQLLKVSESWQQAAVRKSASAPPENSMSEIFKLRFHLKEERQQPTGNLPSP